MTRLTLTAYYQGRPVWTSDGPDWPAVELHPIGEGWTYSLNGRGPTGRDLLIHERIDQ